MAYGLTVPGGDFTSYKTLQSFYMISLSKTLAISIVPSSQII